MPFRIHKYNKCLTYTPSPPSTVFQEECYFHEPVTNRRGEFRYRSIYASTQLFSFFPLLKSLQPIYTRAARADDWCLASVKESDGLIHVKSKSCCNREYCWDQLFAVKIYKDASRSLLRQEDKSTFVAGNKRIVDQSILPVTMNSPLSFAQVNKYADLKILQQWYEGDSSKEFLSKMKTSSLRCMALKPLSPHGIIANNETDILVMEHCDVTSDDQRFIVERTTANAWIKFIRRRLQQQFYNTGKTGDLVGIKL